jgi:hypothetical protein
LEQERVKKIIVIRLNVRISFIAYNDCINSTVVYFLIGLFDLNLLKMIFMYMQYTENHC